MSALVGHTDDCAGPNEAGECEPIEGQWNQPPGTYRQAAEDELGDEAPWCLIVERVGELMGARARGLTPYERVTRNHVA